MHHAADFRHLYHEAWPIEDHTKPGWNPCDAYMLYVGSKPHDAPGPGSTSLSPSEAPTETNLKLCDAYKLYVMLSDATHPSLSQKELKAGRDIKVFFDPKSSKGNDLDCWTGKIISVDVPVNFRGSAEAFRHNWLLAQIYRPNSDTGKTMADKAMPSEKELRASIPPFIVFLGLGDVASKSKDLFTSVRYHLGLEGWTTPTITT
ncbi:hypothetical protein PG994_004048 [Apiospora phragmitis]|uniref:Uncharacterized protein n=1 Tax=Apiospora phragmitis TaxID=2905665 RepID=A0ABR1W2F7_9PEZI